MAIEISAGQLRRKATLMINMPTDNQSGGQDFVFTPVLTCRCMLKKSSGGLVLQQSQESFNKQYKMYCRFQSAIVINTDSIWVIGADSFAVTDYTMLDEVPHFYEFTLQKQ